MFSKAVDYFWWRFVRFYLQQAVRMVFDVSVDYRRKLATSTAVAMTVQTLGMIERSLYLVSYDITKSSIRRKALKITRGYATGGQKSVHECWLSRAERAHLLEELKRLVNPLEDRILVLRLDPRQAVETLGSAVQPLHPDFLYIG